MTKHKHLDLESRYIIQAELDKGYLQGDWLDPWQVLHDHLQRDPKTHLRGKVRHYWQSLQ